MVLTIAGITFSNTEVISLAASAAGLVISIFGLGVSIWNRISQNKTAQFTLQANLLIKLDERFTYDEKFRKIRSKAGERVLGGEIPDTEFDEIFNFFDTLGLYVRLRALHDEMVWHTFSYWIIGYWKQAVKSGYLKEEEKTDKHRWEDFQYLVERMIDIEHDKNLKAISYKPDFPNPDKLPPGDLDSFFKEEKAIHTETTNEFLNE